MSGLEPTPEQEAELRHRLGSRKQRRTKWKQLVGLEVSKKIIYRWIAACLEHPIDSTFTKAEWSAMRPKDDDPMSRPLRSSLPGTGSQWGPKDFFQQEFNFTWKHYNRALLVPHGAPQGRGSRYRLNPVFHHLRTLLLNGDAKSYQLAPMLPTSRASSWSGLSSSSPVALGLGSSSLSSLSAPADRAAGWPALLTLSAPLPMSLSEPRPPMSASASASSSSSNSWSEALASSPSSSASASTSSAHALVVSQMDDSSGELADFSPRAQERNTAFVPGDANLEDDDGSNDGPRGLQCNMCDHPTYDARPIPADSPLRSVFAPDNLTDFLSVSQLSPKFYEDFLHLIVWTLDWNKCKLRVSTLRRNRLYHQVWQDAYIKFFLAPNGERCLIAFCHSVIVDGQYNLKYMCVAS